MSMVAISCLGACTHTVDRVRSEYMVDTMTIPVERLNEIGHDANEGVTLVDRDGHRTDIAGPVTVYRSGPEVVVDLGHGAPLQRVSLAQLRVVELRRGSHETIHTEVQVGGPGEDTTKLIIGVSVAAAALVAVLVVVAVAEANSDSDNKSP